MGPLCKWQSGEAFYVDVFELSQNADLLCLEMEGANLVTAICACHEIATGLLHKHEIIRLSSMLRQISPRNHFPANHTR